MSSFVIFRRHLQLSGLDAIAVAVDTSRLREKHLRRYQIRLLCCMCLFFGLAHTAQGRTVYFMTVFGSQNPAPKAKRAHSFASFIKATGENNNWNDYQLEVHTISWLPETLDIKVWRLLPEPGDNFGLYETLNWAVAGGDKIHQWGPYRICPETYRRAVHRIGVMNHDLLEYQAVDPIFRTEISNCIHAVSGIDPYDGRTRYPLIRIGFSASRHITEVFRENGMILNVKEDHSWLDHRMGLDGYPITNCELESGRLSGGIGVSKRRDEPAQFGERTFHVCPDFIVPPGMRHRPAR